MRHLLLYPRALSGDFKLVCLPAVLKFVNAPRVAIPVGTLGKWGGFTAGKTASDHDQQQCPRASDNSFESSPAEAEAIGLSVSAVCVRGHYARHYDCRREHQGCRRLGRDRRRLVTRYLQLRTT